MNIGLHLNIDVTCVEM